MRHEQLKKIESFDIIQPDLAEAGNRSETAVPDVPAVVGVMMALVYVSIVAVLAVTIANAGTGPFMIAVDIMFLAAFFAVPAIFLKLECDPARRPRMSRFMSQGMQTYTGHVTGSGALIQMFVVPVLLAIGVLCIGIIAMVS